MVSMWKRCETCIHNGICSRKSQYETLTQKIQNIDKNKPYDEFKVTIECGYYRNNGMTDCYQFEIR